MDELQILLLWPGWVRRKREDDFGRIGPALFAGTNNFDSSINKISSTSYLHLIKDHFLIGSCLFSRWVASNKMQGHFRHQFLIQIFYVILAVEEFRPNQKMVEKAGGYHVKEHKELDQKYVSRVTLHLVWGHLYRKQFSFLILSSHSK